MASKGNGRKAQKEIEPKQGPAVIMEIKIEALDNADVNVTFPEKANIWVLRGILAKALDTLNRVTVQK